MPQHNTTVPSGEAYDAARRGVGLIDRSDRGRIVVSGTDRASYLQGLLTNDIGALAAGRGCYAVYLTPQGRMIADLWVYELGDVILLSMHRDVKDTILAKLDQFIFSEDVQLGDVTERFASVALIGPDSARVVAQVLAGVSRDALESLPEHGNTRAQFADDTAIVLRITDPGSAGFELLVDAAQASRLTVAVRDAGAVDVDEKTAEAIRIEGGVPKFHRDMDEETIPLEAGIEARAISLTKGCYVGQEVIIRVLHRGHGRVAKKLVGLTCGGPVAPAAGSIVQVGGREVGRVTSSAASPALNRPIALAYVQRDFIDAGTEVIVGGDPAIVTALPFV